MPIWLTRRLPMTTLLACCMAEAAHCVEEPSRDIESPSTRITLSKCLQAT